MLPATGTRSESKTTKEGRPGGRRRPGWRAVAVTEGPASPARPSRPRGPWGVGCRGDLECPGDWQYRVAVDAERAERVDSAFPLFCPSSWTSSAPPGPSSAPLQLHSESHSARGMPRNGGGHHAAAAAGHAGHRGGPSGVPWRSTARARPEHGPRNDRDGGRRAEPAGSAVQHQRGGRVGAAGVRERGARSTKTTPSLAARPVPEASRAKMAINCGNEARGGEKFAIGRLAGRLRAGCSRLAFTRRDQKARMWMCI